MHSYKRDVEIGEQMDDKTNINLFAKALMKVQATLVHVKRDTQGYGYKYAQLDQCWDTIKKPLTENGFSFMQFPYNEENRIGIHSILLHECGHSLGTKIAMTPVRGDPQTAGSLIAYLRRYSLMSIIGLCPTVSEDDDGEGAMPKNGKDGKPGGGKKDSPPKKPPPNFDNALLAINGCKTVDQLTKLNDRIHSSGFTEQQLKVLCLASDKIAEDLIEKGFQ